MLTDNIKGEHLFTAPIKVYHFISYGPGNLSKQHNIKTVDDSFYCTINFYSIAFSSGNTFQKLKRLCAILRFDLNKRVCLVNNLSTESQARSVCIVNGAQGLFAV